MSSEKLFLSPMSDKEKEDLARYKEEKAAIIDYIRSGKTKEQAEMSHQFSPSIINVAYSTVRPWQLPFRNLNYEADNLPGVPSLTERQKQVLEMTQRCMTQKEIAKELHCSQSTVAFNLKRIRIVQETAARVMAEGKHTVYQTRMHLFLHGMDLWDDVKGVCFDDESAMKDIDEAISLGASEVIFLHLSYSPQQLDKLVMDIVLAAKGRCVIIADSYAVNSLAETHVVYFIRDCIHTKDISGEKGETGWDIPLRCRITYLSDWIKYLQVPLSENDSTTVKYFDFWRGLYEDEPRGLSAGIDYDGACPIG